MRETCGSFFKARPGEAHGAQRPRSPRDQNAFCCTTGQVGKTGNYKLEGRSEGRRQKAEREDSEGSLAARPKRILPPAGERGENWKLETRRQIKRQKAKDAGLPDINR